MTDAAGWRERFEDTALLWGLVGIVAILSVLPLARLLLEGIAPNGQFSTAALTHVLSSPTTWTATQHSLITAFGGTVVAVVAAAGHQDQPDADRHRQGRAEQQRQSEAIRRTVR